MSHTLRIGRIIPTQILRQFSSKVDAKLLIAQMSGLTRFASRKDALMCCGSVVPSRIEAILDRNYFPTGNFVITVKSAEELASLKSHQNHLRPVKFDDLTTDQYDSIKTTTNSLISMRTLRVELSNNATCTREDIQYLFRDYQLVHLRLLGDRDRNFNPNHSSLFLVDFENAEEAERAAHEKIDHVVFIGKVKLIWYNC